MSDTAYHLLALITAIVTTFNTLAIVCITKVREPLPQWRNYRGKGATYHGTEED
jgi:hypothetical protein